MIILSEVIKIGIFTGLIVMIVPLTELLLIVHNFLNKVCKNSYLYDF